VVVTVPGSTTKMALRLKSLLTTLVAAFLVAGTGGAVRAPDKRPNVVIILADDLGWGDLGCYGHPKFKTPNLDRMAAEGARLTDFYSTCPYCAPSRAALLTGRYQFRSGVTRNPAPDAGVDDVGIPASETTLAEVFKSAGYRTICIGKWHLGHRPEFYPTRHGFQEYLGILYSNDMRPVQLLDGEKVVEYPVVQATLTRRYTERALSFLDRNRDQRFFLYLPHAMPHKPLAASEAFYKKSGAGLYGDAVAELDWSVGQILAKIRELGIDDRTLVFFTSDNGPWYGGSTGGLRGMKGLTWEGGIREPLIARWPGRIPAGRVSREAAIMPDLFATSLAAADVPIPRDRVIDGNDILALLASDAKSPHEALFSMAGERLHTIRSGRWKLHLLPPGNPRVLKPGDPWTDPRAPDGVTLLAPYEQAHPSQYPGVLTGDQTRPMSLIDLQDDPAEQRDVADQHPEIVRRLRGLFEQFNRQVPAAPRADRRLESAAAD
jgi:N-acetylgalactosamine-6-sulfatase